KTESENESRLRVHSTVFESIMEGVAVTDADVNIISVNPAFTHITGFKPEEVLGRNPKIMKSGRHDKEFYRKMWESINLYGSWSGEIWNRRKSGKIQPEWLNITRVCDEAGATTNYVASFIDTSAIRASQEQLHFLAHHDNLTGLPNRLL
ncbi:MAG: PAS domain S-box protein, partial [Gammaproteobacteria bacterium]|nr:PAS domain S-box protein [Gammaproteobacteria bacterium]